MTSTTAMAGTYEKLPNKLVSGANGVDYAYRDAGDGRVPLVLLQHFRGNLDSWDPALINALASGRRVVTFDNAGVGGSTGQTPNTVEQMAHDADDPAGHRPQARPGVLCPAGRGWHARLGAGGHRRGRLARN